jgi:hypothetical protein
MNMVLEIVESIHCHAETIHVFVADRSPLQRVVSAPLLG